MKNTANRKKESSVCCIREEELDNKEPVGDMVKCTVCGKMHKVEHGKDVNTSEECKLLAFIKCSKNGKCYLVGLQERLFEETIMKEKCYRCGCEIEKVNE